uniref:Uncharacterized protein n=1 Tax=Magallana gigas TaxID=29159 RepID=A0A8W8NYC0_MAGGI
MDDNTTNTLPQTSLTNLFRCLLLMRRDKSPLETNEPVRLRRKIDGGSKVTGYVVKQKRGSDGDWEEVATLKAIETSYKVPKLDEDQEYFFSI